MKEIDLLPEWYKNSRRQKRNLRGQYIALGVVMVVMVIWNFAAGHSISKAKAELAQGESQRIQAENIFKQFNQVKGHITELQKKADVLREVDSRIDTAKVLSELSYLVGRRVVLSRVEFKAEKFLDMRESKTQGGLRIARAGSGSNAATLLGNVRFKAVINGIAPKTSDVGQLVRKLEDSPYFCSVSLSFSRNKKIKLETALGKQDSQVSEFEIGCFLANYKQEACLAKNLQN